MRTVNDIVPPSRRKEDLSSEPLRIREKPPRFPYATLVVALAVILGAIGALFYFSSAKVEVTPNTISAAVQSTFTSTSGTGDLPFQVITAQKIASQAVKSSGTKLVNSYASGSITIMNTQAKAQTLIANTRFATPEGLIFRIHSTVTVPAGTTAKPGTAAARVYADKAGPAYNVAATTFTIPGFAGTPLATKVFAKSSSAMTGGASGQQPVIDPSTEAQTRAALKTALAPDLESALKGQVPEGYVLLPGAATTTYDELSSDAATTGQVEVKEQGTVTAVVFPNAALAKAIAASVAGFGYQGEAMTLTSTAELTLVPTDGIPTTDSNSFAFTLAGTAPLMYTVDPTRIAAAVSGKTRQAAEVALTNYPEVKRAIIILRPFWRQTFPQDPAQISVVIDSQN
ncbi:MAG TPA: hypothetical protein VFP46_02800 [Candidatus Paceibacterota bacterium]|nr:hypothetical protein [Candidatus Paceibacterota bacterium]